MNDNRDRKKGSATPWLLGAGALGLGGIGIALASKGKAKTGSVAKKAAAIDVPKPKVQQLNAAKPQPSIKDELDQLRNQGQAKPKADMQDELDRMRNEAPKPKAKPANMGNELGRMRAEQPKPQPTIKEEVAALKNAEPIKTEPKKPTGKSGASGYSGLSKNERRTKLEKRRRDLAEGLYDTDPNFDVTKKKDPELFRAANSLKVDSKTGKLKRNAALQRMEVNSNTMLYGGSDSKRIKNNQKIKERNEAAIKRAKQIAKNTRGEYNAHIFLLCDL